MVFRRTVMIVSGYVVDIGATGVWIPRDGDGECSYKDTCVKARGRLEKGDRKECTILHTIRISTDNGIEHGMVGVRVQLGLQPERQHMMSITKRNGTVARLTGSSYPRTTSLSFPSLSLTQSSASVAPIETNLAVMDPSGAFNSVTSNGWVTNASELSSE